MTRDPVTPAVRDYVLRRDKACLLWAMDPDHQCRDIWGTPHDPRDLNRLTLEHVKDQPRMGRRAPSDARHMVALCGAANVGVPSKEQRAAFRSYLARVETA